MSAKPVSKISPAFAGFLAGAPGFEPRSTAPKAGVLPLHHAPVRTQLYHKLYGALLPLSDYQTDFYSHSILTISSTALNSGSPVTTVAPLVCAATTANESA